MSQASQQASRGQGKQVASKRSRRDVPLGMSLARWAFVTAAVASLWTPACSPAGDETARDVQPSSALAGKLAGQDCLIIVMDALSSRHLGCYGQPLPTSPEIDGFAAGAIRFTHAWSQTSWTLPSTVSLMTGLYQESHGVRAPGTQLAPSADTLAEAFARAGYATLGFTQNAFASDAFGLGQGFQSLQLMPALDEELAPGERRADERFADAVLAALGPRGSGPPRFVYCHFRRPHMPYDAPAAERALFCDPAYDGPVKGVQADFLRHNAGEFKVRGKDLEQLTALYHAGIHEADYQVGRILEGIDRTSTMVLLLADHGEELSEHGLLGHNFTSYEELVHIPMLWSHPSFTEPSATAPGAGPAPPSGTASGAGRDVGEPVMSIDVLPTLAELFGLDVTARPHQGRSLAPELAGGEGPARAAVFTSSRANANQMFAATDGHLKYLILPAAGLEQLFDLQADPREIANLAPLHPADTERWRALMADWRSHQRRLGWDEAATTDAATDERLEALGYVGGAR